MHVQHDGTGVNVVNGKKGEPYYKWWDRGVYGSPQNNVTRKAFTIRSLLYLFTYLESFVSER